MLMWDNFYKLNSMFWLYMFVTTVLSSSVQASNEVITLPKDLEDWSIRELRQSFKTAVESRCLKNADEAAFSDLKASVFNLGCCILNYIWLPSNNEPDVKNSLNVRRAYTCLKGLIEKAEPCLNEEEKYLFELFLGAHNASVDLLNRYGSKNIEATVAAFKSANCTPPIRYVPLKLYETCALKLDHIKALDFSSYILKPADFCHDLEIAYECAIDGAKSLCNDDESVIETIKELFEYLLNFCQYDIAANSEITQVLYE